MPELGEGFTVTAAEPVRGGYRIAIELRDGTRRELIVGEHMADQLATVEIPDELPIILCIRAPEGELPWRFDYLGRPDPAHQLSEAVGPELPTENPEPYVFDPTDHMDLQTAEPAPPLPPPAPPGGPPPDGAQTAPPNPVPPPGRPLGAYGDQSIPFQH
jgi:hypothetical protein